MKEILLSKTGKIAFSLMLISLLLIIIARLTLEIMMRTNSLSAAIFSACYGVIYASIFLFPASVITLIILVIKRSRKRRISGKIK
jgi:hypothetical protein